jgi:hypothetical protein
MLGRLKVKLTKNADQQDYSYTVNISTSDICDCIYAPAV